MGKEIVMYTFKTCPYCIRAKKLFEAEGIKYKEIDISNNYKKLEELELKTNCDTVPQIFVDDEFIGGCDDVVALHREGRFDNIFK